MLFGHNIDNVGAGASLVGVDARFDHLVPMAGVSLRGGVVGVPFPSSLWRAMTVLVGITQSSLDSSGKRKQTRSG
jgi:hypothetical protein